jgi:hypothetical protein
MPITGAENFHDLGYDGTTRERQEDCEGDETELGFGVSGIRNSG